MGLDDHKRVSIAANTMNIRFFITIPVVLILLGCVSAGSPPKEWAGRLNIWGMPGATSFFVLLTPDGKLFAEKTENGTARSSVIELKTEHFQKLKSLWLSAVEEQGLGDSGIVDGTNAKVEWYEGRKLQEHRRIANLSAVRNLHELVMHLNTYLPQDLQLY